VVNTVDGHVYRCVAAGNSWSQFDPAANPLADPGANGIVKRTAVGTTALASTSDITALLPPFTGDVTTTAGAVAATVQKVNGVAYPASSAINTVPVVTGASQTTYQQLTTAQISTSALSGNTAKLATVAGTPTGSHCVQWDNSGNVTDSGAPCGGGGGTSGLPDPGGNGMVVRTGAGTTTNRSLNGTANRVLVSDGDGSAGNPTVDLATSVVTRPIGWNFNGSGLTIPVNTTGFLTVPYACTVSRWTLHAQGGSATVDIWRTSDGSADPTVLNSITGSGAPRITSGTNASGTTALWSSDNFAANDNIAFSITAVSGATNITVILNCIQ
jgi:hypothetical protein